MLQLDILHNQYMYIIPQLLELHSYKSATPATVELVRAIHTTYY